MRSLLAFLFLCAAALGADLPKVEPLPIGAKAPAFKLPGTDGREYTLDDFKDAPVLVVVFTCNHCPTAQAYEDRLKKLVEEYKDKHVSLIAISPNDPKSVRLDELGYTDLGDSFEDMKIRAKEKGFNFPYLYDGDTEEISRAYGPATTPHAFVFDNDRRLRYAGRVDDAERESFVKTQDLRSAIDAVLSGKKPDVEQTKAFGCSIKWAGKADQVKAFMDKLAQEPVTVEPIDEAGLAELRKGDAADGKVRLVNFWATWCGPCVTQFPELVEINRMYRKRDFEFVTVAANYPDEKNQVLKFLTAQQASNRNLLFGSTEKYKLMEAFDKEWSGALPFTILLGAKGEVLYRHEGAVDSMELKKTILNAIGREK